MVSGDKVADARAEDAGTITDLKKYLHQLGLPTRFQQRMMYESRLLEEDRAPDAKWLRWGDGGPGECLRLPALGPHNH